MTCSGDGSTGVKTQRWQFLNWARTQRVLVPVIYNPTSVAQIVAAVQEVEGRKETVKAIGSQWAYGGVAVDESTQNVINTRLLNHKLSDDDPAKAIIPFALRDELKPDKGHYVHVAAGIRIWQLNCMLDTMLVAMPTLGGSNGQTLAGAIATGTHGADVNAPPIADAVAAIHLVGPGGKEWWIERDEGAGAITDPGRMAQARARGLLCADARVEYDTSLFRAVLVSMGRMGVVYSYVLKTVDRFALRTSRFSSTWTAERANLRMPNDPFGGARWLEIYVNPYPDASGEHRCLVTKKYPAPPTVTTDDLVMRDTLDYFCRSDEITQILVGLNLVLPALMAAVSSTAATALSPLNAVPVIGPGLYALAMAGVVAPYTLLQQDLAILLAESPGGNFADQLANVLNQAVHIPQGKRIIPEIEAAIATSVRPLSEDGTTRESFKSYTGQRSCPEEPLESSNCERQIDGMELAFDMTPGSTNVFDFIDDVFAASDALYAADAPAVFGMALRFTGKTEALLGMQQWERTCLIEIFSLRGVASTPGWIAKLYELGARHGAIPHWGLLNELTATQVHDRYPKLSEWRQALRKIIDDGGGRAETFRSTYSLARGLEPETFMPPTVAVPLDESGQTYPYDFGTVQLHDQKSVEFHFANNGQHELKVLGHDAGGDFAIQDRPPTAANLEADDVRPIALPSEEIRVRVTFRALRAGEHHGTFKIYINAANLGAIVIPLHARVEAFSLAVVQPSPAVLDLGAVAIESTAAATLVVRNDSTVAAWLGDVTFSNQDAASQVAVQTGGIGLGATRAYALEYRPSFVGPFATDVVLHFTDGATPPRHTQDVTVKLSAVGRGAQLELAPSEFDFGSAVVGAESVSAQITLRNIGLDPLSISGPLIGGDYRMLTPLPDTIAGGQSAHVAILFAPRGVGARDSSFSVASDSLRPPTPIELHGVGVAAPILRATPSPVVFGDTVAGSSRAATVEVGNPGAMPVAIGTVGLQAPGAFQIVRDRCTGVTLAVGATCSIDVKFAPAAAGANAATVEVSGPAQPLAVELSGRGLPAAGLVPDVSDVDFGEVPVGEPSKTRRVTLTNEATAAANVTDIVIQGPSAAEVTVAATDCTGAALAPGASCTVDLRLAPAGIGTRSAALTALADVPAYGASLHALGRGVAVDWIPGELDFGNMNVGVQTPAQDAELRNTGNATLQIARIEVADDAADFVITELTPGIRSLQPGGDLGFRIRFKPTAAGNRHAALQIYSDAAGSPHTLALAGVGFAPP